jgi:hypothetical protein
MCEIECVSVCVSERECVYVSVCVCVCYTTVGARHQANYSFKAGCTASKDLYVFQALCSALKSSRWFPGKPPNVVFLLPSSS